MQDYLLFLIPLLKGAQVTFSLAVCAMFFSLLIGFLGALLKMTSYKFLHAIINIYINLIRSIPELLIVFLIYFGSSFLLTSILGTYIEINNFLAGVISLSLIFGAYAIATFRGSYLSIPHNQLTAAQAYGFRKIQIFYYIILPQMIRYALPGISNLWLNLLKDTALISLIGLNDLLMQAQLAASNTQKPFTFYCIALFIYLCFTHISNWVFIRLEKKFALVVN